jgi:hypothetical protein
MKRCVIMCSFRANNSDLGGKKSNIGKIELLTSLILITPRLFKQPILTQK